MKKNFAFLAKKKMLSPFKFYLLLICPLPVFTVALSKVFESDFGHQFMYEHAMKVPQEMSRLHSDLYGYLSRIR